MLITTCYYTHISENVLICTHNTSSILANQPTNDILLTHHYAIKCTLNINKNISSELLSFQNLRNIDITHFSLDILSKVDINNFITIEFNTTLSNILDKYVLINNRTIKNGSTIYAILIKNTNFLNNIYIYIYIYNNYILYNTNKNKMNNDNFLLARS